MNIVVAVIVDVVLRLGAPRSSGPDETAAEDYVVDAERAPALAEAAAPSRVPTVEITSPLSAA